MKWKIKKELQTIFKDIDFAGIFNLENLHTLQPDYQFFENWIHEKKHAKMLFLEKNSEVRQNPNYILNGAKTALVFLFPYSFGHKVRRKQKNFAEPDASAKNLGISENSLYGKKVISKYVYSKDYHKIIKKYLNAHAIKLQEKLKLSFEFRPVVDSIPFFERAFARDSGLGFIGKNTLLIRPGAGSFFFIGTLLTTLDISVLTESEPQKNPLLDLNCGDCTRCIDACPTSAIEEKYTLNANKCLSYLTIEHRDIIPKEFLKKLNQTIYGCDICQDVCPYNFVTQEVAMLAEFKKIHEPFLVLQVEDIALMTEQQYQKWFCGSAMTRAKYQGLVRNALYYLHANEDQKLPQILDALKSSSYELIQKTVKQIIEVHDES